MSNVAWQDFSSLEILGMEIKKLGKEIKEYE